MKIKAIEPTPSPNTMKVILTTQLPEGSRNNYRKESMEEAPSEIREILAIDGVKGVYHVADFLAVERHPKARWEDVLPQVRKALGDETEEQREQEGTEMDHFGEVRVQVQFFKGIPMQVKLLDGQTEKRFGLPAYFTEGATEAQLPGENIVLLRKWVDRGVRYGELEEIGETVVEELMASYPEDRVRALVAAAKNPDQKPVEQRYRKLTPEDLDDPDWKKRYQALEQMEAPSIEDLPLLEKALNDEKTSIRRLAVVYLGMIEDRRVLPYIYKALRDPAVAVRRTAGDCLSDLGFPEAQDEMIRALKDKSKLVRWRAAMFLYETGDERALPALKEAADDPEFEVAMQVKMAIERIESGEEAKGSVWKQMTEARKSAD